METISILCLPEVRPLATQRNSSKCAACSGMCNLQVLQEIRDKGGGELNLPQICVVGDQSSGKSSALTCITGITFTVIMCVCVCVCVCIDMFYS